MASSFGMEATFGESGRGRVALGGRSRGELDRAQLLADARNKREKRAREREEKSAATTLQRFFRGFRGRRQARAEIRERWQQRVKVEETDSGPALLRRDGKAWEEEEEQACCSAAAFFQEVRRKRRDVERVASAGGVLMEVEHGYEDEVALASAIIASVARFGNELLKLGIDDDNLSVREKEARTMAKLKPYLRLIMDMLGCCCDKLITDLPRELQIALLRALGALRIISDETTTSKNIATTLLRYGTKKLGLLPTIRRLVLMSLSHPDPQHPAIQSILQIGAVITVRCADAGLAREVALSLLSIPNVWTLWHNLTPSAGAVWRPCCVAMANDSESDCTSESVYPYAIVILENLAAAAAAETARSSTGKAFDSYRMGLSFAKAAVNLGQSAMSCSKQEGLCSNEKLTRDLSNGIILTELVGHLTSEDAVWSEDGVVLGNFLFLLLVMLSNGTASSAVTALAFRAHFVERCWPRLSSVMTTAAETPPLLPLIGAFCSVYAHELIVIDDEDMYNEGRPLSLRSMSSLVGMIKGVVVKLILDRHSLIKKNPLSTKGGQQDPSAPRSLWSVDKLLSFVYKSTTSLLSKLYDRNSRRNFVPPELFIADLGGIRFINEAIGSLEDLEEEQEEEDDDDPSTASYFAGKSENRMNARTVLQSAPFLIPFEHRVRILQGLIGREREHDYGLSSRDRLRWHGQRKEVLIRRDHVVNDAWMHMGELTGSELKRGVRINFVNQFGLAEAGVDGGGLFKDFLDTFCKAAFDPQCGLFQETPDHQLFPSPVSSLVVPNHLPMFQFLGRIVGKALYDGILVELPFAGFFLTKLRGRSPGMHDLSSLDPDLARSMRFLRKFEGDVENLSIYFVVDDHELNTDAMGKPQEVELVPGGRNMIVTSDSVVTYTHLVANHRLNTQIRAQTGAFLSGLLDMVKTRWLAMFNEGELQILLSGAGEGVDVDDLLRHVTFSGGYTADHSTISILWDVLRDLSPIDQRKFLKFVTACSRAPLLGFGSLEPRICIHRSGTEGSDAPDSTADTSRLPTSATCMNLLKIPPYKSAELLRDKLMYAISHVESGFDLA